MIKFVKQKSKLSRFIGTNEDTGDLLPEQVWSDLVWVTEFAEALSLDGLTLSWRACTIYMRGKAYMIPAGSYQFAADINYSQSVTVWLDDSASDNITIDITLLDGQRKPDPAPTANGDILKLAWGTIGANANAMNLNALYHVEDM